MLRYSFESDVAS